MRDSDPREVPDLRTRPQNEVSEFLTNFIAKISRDVEKLNYAIGYLSNIEQNGIDELYQNDELYEQTMNVIYEVARSQHYRFHDDTLPPYSEIPLQNEIQINPTAQQTSQQNIAQPQVANPNNPVGHNARSASLINRVEEIRRQNPTPPRRVYPQRTASRNNRVEEIRQQNLTPPQSVDPQRTDNLNYSVAQQNNLDPHETIQTQTNQATRGQRRAPKPFPRSSSLHHNRK